MRITEQSVKYKSSGNSNRSAEGDSNDENFCTEQDI